jgi:hypothetical protein
MKALSVQRMHLLLWLAVALWCGLSLLAAAYVRYAWIEEPQLAAQCDAGAASWVCTLRAWIIQAFVHQRIGWAALALAVCAFAMTWPWLASVALLLACSGLVLYSTEISAPAALLAGLVFAKLDISATAAKLSSNAP